MNSTRRGFVLAGSGLAVVALGGLTVGWLHDPGPNPLLKKNAPTDPHPFNAFVQIGEDGNVTVAVARAEMGQGVHTALAKLVADQLDVPWDQVKVVGPPTSKHYVNHKLLEDGYWRILPHDHECGAEAWRETTAFVSELFSTMQITGGSASVRDAWEPMRRAGATARAMLMQAAAKRWGVSVQLLDTREGKVVGGPSGATFGYGELAREAATIVLPRPVRPRQGKPSRLVDMRAPRLDTPKKVNGKAEFGIDVRPSELLYAAVRSAPTLSGRLASDPPASPKDAFPRIVKVDERTVAVVDHSYWTAQRAVGALELAFTNPSPGFSSSAVDADFARHIAETRGFVFRDHGDARAQLTHDVIEAEYQAPYLGHACMEPLNCTARFVDGRCELWLGTQAPGLVVWAVARALRMLPSSVTVHTTLLGGGFGRRLEVDVAVQAARIAREFPGQTVKLIWSREEDMRRDVFRPAAVARVRGTLDGDRMPCALLARVCSQSVNRDFAWRNLGLPFPLPDKTNVEGLYDQPYAIPHCRVEHIEAQNDVPVGNWRSVGHAFNGFAMECFLDELAHAGGKDPFDVRFHLLPRHEFPEKVELLARLREVSGWDKPKLDGVHGRGMAYRQNFGSDVAQVVDIAIKDGHITVKKVFCVIDCGQPVDRRGIEAQVESGIVYGLSAALTQAVTIKDGAVQQSNFHQFDALRINQCPEIEVHIVANNKRIGGAGETAVPPVAPALANAMFEATGKRIRKLPLCAKTEWA